jgi:hypothetical protein
MNTAPVGAPVYSPVAGPRPSESIAIVIPPVVEGVIVG